MTTVEPVQADFELSNDALVLLTAWFAFGEKTQVTIGGEGAQSHISPRAKVAIDELIAAGLVTAKPFNNYGRMTYTGTERCRDLRLSQSAMEKHGKWSATIPNPAGTRKPEVK